MSELSLPAYSPVLSLKKIAYNEILMRCKFCSIFHYKHFGFEIILALIVIF